ncbi:MAG: SusD/RagB family nutrient-binding outer membrane lipoprotein, partial [Chitinophagaceae bacterium]
MYIQIQSLLDEGIADIGRNTGLTPASDDYIYAGDMTKWRKLAYTLKARYYLHLSKAPGNTA